MRRLPIRARLALLYAGLAALLLAGVTLTVYTIERNDVNAQLRRDATSEAKALAVAASADGQRRPDADEASGVVPVNDPATRALRRYLASRSGARNLLYVVEPDGDRLRNRKAALQLATYTAAGSHPEQIRVGDNQYTVAAARSPSGAWAVAGVPRDELDDRLRNLLFTMIFVTVGGLLVTVLLAWIAASRALAPLNRIANRASQISAGALDQRVGEVASHDEIAEVAHAIDGMLDRIEAAFAAQRRFVNDASHELRTPITIARGHLEVLAMQERPDPAEVREVVDLAVAELGRMSRLVDSLLRLARISEKGLDRPRRVPLRAIAADALDRVRSTADREWVLDAPEEPELVVMGEADALEQVLLNLLANAARHTHVGGRIAITIRRRGVEAVVAVSDDGEGIDPRALPTIFDRFARADAARRRDTGGAGLGLAICRDIVTVHGGVIAADSQIGAGATFTIVLPLAEADQQADPAPRTARRSASASA